MRFGGRERIVKRGGSRIYEEEGARWRSEWDKGRGFRVQRTERRLEREREDGEVEKVSEEGGGRGGITLLWKGALLR